MNTYRLYFVLLAVLFLGCSKSSNDTDIDDNDGPNVDADYSVLLTANGILSETLLNANAEYISINPASEFESTTTPELSYRDGSTLSYYIAKPGCSGTLTKVDFSDNSSKNFNVFEDLQNCGMEVISITHSEHSIFLVFSIPGSGAEETHYFIRIVDTDSSETLFTDHELDKEPKQIVFSSNKVFILSFDEDEEDKFALVVYDNAIEGVIHDLNLDFSAQKIFKTIDENILVSYPELHLVIDHTSLGITNTVRYNEGKEPKFGYTDASFFDNLGNLYYPMPTGLSGTEYPNIPGVYDFSTNTAVLYFYENFLTEAEREFEFEIGDTSMVSYDVANNLILIGYQKSGDANKGGLLRIRPIPEPKFIDNIDLNGVPFEMFVN